MTLPARMLKDRVAVLADSQLRTHFENRQPGPWRARSGSLRRCRTVNRGLPILRRPELRQVMKPPETPDKDAVM